MAKKEQETRNIITVKPGQLMRLLLTLIPQREPVMIVGPPGVGKTAMGEQAGTTLGADVLFEHPVVSDPTDPKGLPWVVDGKATFLPFGNLEKMMTAEKLTIVFIDDLGQAIPAVQAGYMQLVHARKINGHNVSPNVCFLTATNRREDKAAVSGIIEPLKGRFITILHVEPDLEDLVEYAIKAKWPTDVIAFVRFKPEMIYDFKPTLDLTNSPTPRTIESLARLRKLNLDGDLQQAAYAGAIGAGYAMEYMAFQKTWNKMPNRDKILMDPDNAEVPDVKERPDVLYATCGALAAAATEQTFPRIIRYANRLPSAFSVLMVRDCLRYDKTLTNTQAFIEWASKNRNVLL